MKIGFCTPFRVLRVFRDWLRVYLRSQVDSLDRPYFKLVSPFSKWVGVFLEYRSALQVREPSAVVGAQSHRSVEHCWSSSKSWWLITALRAWSRCRPMWVLWTASHVSDRINVLNCQTGGVSRVHLTGGWALHAVLLNCSRVCPWLYLFRCSPSLLCLLSHPP